MDFSVLKFFLKFSIKVDKYHDSMLVKWREIKVAITLKSSQVPTVVATSIYDENFEKKTIEFLEAGSLFIGASVDNC